MINLSRRQFTLAGAAAAALAPMISRAAISTDVPWAGEKIVDCHFHERPTDAAMIAHLDGAGVSHALVLAFGDFAGRMSAMRGPDRARFLGWARGAVLVADGASTGDAGPASGLGPVFPPVGKEETESVLKEYQRNGWKGFAETAGRVAVDGPELRRIYALAAELDVPVMLHFQESVVPGQPVYGITGFSRIEPMLKQFPNTRFVCHASDFWGNIDATFTDGGAYPMGKVHRGGLSDRLLAEYPNMFADLGAPSGLIQLARDMDFTADFLQRHQHKLMFGSDCGCTDGRGGSGLPAKAAPPPAPAMSDEIDASNASDMQRRMAASIGLAGKCVARELLNIAWSTNSRDVFRRLVWENAHTVYKL